MSDIGIKIIIVAAAIAVGVAARWIPRPAEKQVIEKAADEIIKDETGLDANLEKQ